MVKKVRVTRQGLTSCPSCLSHIEVASELDEVQCPFCGEQLVAAVWGDVGSGTMRMLRNSRSGLVAAALAGLAFTACGETEPKDPTDTGSQVNNETDTGDDMGTVVQEDMNEEPVNVQDYAQAPVKNDEVNG